MKDYTQGTHPSSCLGPWASQWLAVNPHPCCPGNQLCIRSGFFSPLDPLPKDTRDPTDLQIRYSSTTMVRWYEYHSSIYLTTGASFSAHLGRPFRCASRPPGPVSCLLRRVCRVAMSGLLADAMGARFSVFPHAVVCE